MPVNPEDEADQAEGERGPGAGVERVRGDMDVRVDVHPGVRAWGEVAETCVAGGVEVVAHGRLPVWFGHPECTCDRGGCEEKKVPVISLAVAFVAWSQRSRGGRRI